MKTLTLSLAGMLLLVASAATMPVRAQHNHAEHGHDQHDHAQHAAAAVTLKGQIVCSTCWFEADRKTTTGLAGYLKERNLRTLYFCGLATDFCVAWSALDARAAGFDATVIEDACRAIDLEGSCARAWADMSSAGVKRIASAHL